jgi:hypothetical protein
MKARRKSPASRSKANNCSSRLRINKSTQPPRPAPARLDAAGNIDVSLHAGLAVATDQYSILFLKQRSRRFKLSVQATDRAGFMLHAAFRAGATPGYSSWNQLCR